MHAFLIFLLTTLLLLEAHLFFDFFAFLAFLLLLQDFFAFLSLDDLFLLLLEVFLAHFLEAFLLLETFLQDFFLLRGAHVLFFFFKRDLQGFLGPLLAGRFSTFLKVLHRFLPCEGVGRAAAAGAVSWVAT